MTEPTRDALHAETETWLRNKRDTTTGGERSKRILAYAAACVKRVPELEAEVARLREYEAFVAALDAGRISTHIASQWVYVDSAGKGHFGNAPQAAYRAAQEGTDA